MRVCVLSPSYENSNSVFSGLDPDRDPAPYMRHLPQYEFETHFITKASAVQQTRALVQSNRFDVFINLCDGAFDEDRAGIEVVKTLEMFKVPFSGASSDFYEPSKEVMKMVAIYEGVKTPSFLFAFEPKDVELAIQTLQFPLIVKHFNGYSSIGMTKRSRCDTAEELRTEAARFVASFGGALIEEFIAGREATVLVAENFADPSNPIAFLPVECAFPPGETFKHFDLKWNDYDGLQWKPIHEPELVQKLQDASKRIFVALKGVSFGRCDLRICEKTGEVHFLEINPNCGIFYPPDTPGSADCILQLDPMQHSGFIEHMIKTAIDRHKAAVAAEPKCVVRHHPKRGYVLCARTDVPAGAVVVPFEERPMCLVSRAHMEQTWTGHKKQWFQQYAWPLSDRLYVMQSDRPEEWRPIPHACDPSAWFAGDGSLDIVARRPIAAGAEITIDYATFSADDMPEFDCHCGAAQCRGRIRGSDYSRPAVREAYGLHVSDYILTKLRNGRLTGEGRAPRVDADSADDPCDAGPDDSPGHGDEEMNIPGLDRFQAPAGVLFPPRILSECPSAA